MAGFVDPKYFDYAASSPPWREAMDAFIEASGVFYANPSANHLPGKEAKEKLLGLKKEFCDMLHFYDGRLLLCSSASEANTTIIEGHLKRFPQGKLLIAEDVHDSIWYTAEKYPEKIEVLNIDSSGKIPVDRFEKDLDKGISMVCVSHACNETGVIHPVKKMADLCYRKQIRVLIDGAQTVGHLSLDLNNIPFTYFTFSGHKFGSVRSSGGILFRDDEFAPLIRGGKQEWNLRAGTENIAGLSSMVAALKKSVEHLDEEMERLTVLRRVLLERIEILPDVLINSPVDGLPGLLSLSIPSHSGREITGALSMSGFSVSTGSACHESQMTPPRIISAMERSKKEAIGTIRISMGRGNTVDTVNDLADALLELIK